MLTRNLDKAREAFKQKNIEESIKAHHGCIAPEIHTQEKGQYIKSLVYGGLDGIVTTFAAVAGVAGASLSPGVVLIMGFANLVADGLSMAIGDYLSTKAEREYKQAERTREIWEIDNYSEGEKQELIEIYTHKGLDKNDAKAVVDILSKNKKAWIEVMMVEELGIIEDEESPIKNALVTFFSFSLFGFVPLAAYIFSSMIPFIQSNTFLTACILTGSTLFTLGALKVRITARNWFVSGFEMLLVGGIAAASAYVIGLLLSGLA